MRTDAIIDKQQVRCPHASTLGFGKWKAQVGDIVHFTEGNTQRIGRMIGRVKYAPNLQGGKPLRNFILAVVLFDLDHTGERWIDPETVTRVESIREHRMVTEWFLSDQMNKASIDEIRRCVSAGWNNLDRYREWKRKLEQDQKDFYSRHPKGVCQCDFCLKFKIQEQDKEQAGA